MSLDWDQNDHSDLNDKLKGSRNLWQTNLSCRSSLGDILCTNSVTTSHYCPLWATQLYTDFGQTSLQWVKEYAENINDLQGSKKNQRIWASLYNACQRLERNQFRKCHANMLSLQYYLWRDLTIRVMSASMFCLIKALGKPGRNNSGFSLTLSSCCESLRT